MTLNSTYRPKFRSEIDSKSVLQREVFWKSLRGDVFRKPSFPLFFSAFVGAGIQVLCCFYITLLSTMASTYSPINIYN
jgi:hypothetical protein